MLDTSTFCFVFQNSDIEQFKFPACKFLGSQIAKQFEKFFESVVVSISCHPDIKKQMKSHSRAAKSSLKMSSDPKQKQQSRKKPTIFSHISQGMSTSSVCTKDGQMKDANEPLQGKKNEKKEWTVKEIQSRKNILFRFLNNEINYMHCHLSSDQEQEEGKDILRQHIEFFFAFYYTIERIGPLPFVVLNKYRREAGQQLSKSKSVAVICKVVLDEWKKCSKRQETNAIKPPSQLMLTALSILLNLSDSSPEVTYDIVGEPNFLITLKDILTSYFHERTQGEEMSKGENEMIGTSLSIIQNLSTVDENISPLREHGIVAVVNVYLDSKTMLDRFKSLGILANIIDEKESEILHGKDDLLRMFLETLKTALQTPSHRCLVDLEDYSAWECTLTIQHLARNHANKKLLVEMGCLPHLVELAKIGIVEETRVAVGAIWLLAFDKDNQKKIMEDEELNIIDVLFNIKETSKDKESKDRADETLWLIREELERNEKYKNKVSLYSNRNKVQADVKGGFFTGAADNMNGRIMISYNRVHRMELIQIKDKLKENGYSVWMNIDDMFGSVTQAMADAVEFADVVLICMSNAYKNSVDCKHFSSRKRHCQCGRKFYFVAVFRRSLECVTYAHYCKENLYILEADYAYQLRKKIVPLKMEEDFVPNGWLGLIVAGKKNYDVSGKYEFEAKLNDLLKELASQLQTAVSEAGNHAMHLPQQWSVIPGLADDGEIVSHQRPNVCQRGTDNHCGVRACGLDTRACGLDTSSQLLQSDLKKTHDADSTSHHLFCEQAHF
ncbi:hypothetical protein CHS0354_027738 [Potamilus streckersoni]|uniref:TIR domain-containing protein n=1 Tax=Potamilus streckersoni TaxID=2493646 RepID=A0AAE0S725_9BIVA|nr:hypothetical protein CHS0354_027738 [Potamilus streckersoni]